MASRSWQPTAGRGCRSRSRPGKSRLKWSSARFSSPAPAGACCDSRSSLSDASATLQTAGTLELQVTVHQRDGEHLRLDVEADRSGSGEALERPLAHAQI